MPLIIVAACILLLLVLILLKLHPLLALLIVAITAGIGLGMPVQGIIQSIKNGIGTTLGETAMVLALGAILAKMLEKTGAMQQVAQTLLQAVGLKNVQWAILLTAFVVGIPMFYNAGFVIMLPLVFAMAATARVNLLYVAIPMAAALSVTHGFLPPHPGPTVLAGLFKANVGKVLLYGLIIAIPLVIIAGIIFSQTLKNVLVNVEGTLLQSTTFDDATLPGRVVSFVTALMPVIIIAISTIGLIFFKDGLLHNFFVFAAEPLVALLLAVLFATVTLFLQKNKTLTAAMSLVGDAVGGIAIIMLIIAAGGAFKQILVDSGAGKYLISATAHWQLSPLLFAWLLTALLRLALGSATVSALTAAGMVLPLLQTAGVSAELMVLSVGAGSLFFSHVNDTGFWMFKEYFNLSLKQTFLSWSMMETIISVGGLLGVLLLEKFV